jgi:hypothetical protein
MAIILALLIVGWLVAFALGAQAGFENQPEVSEQPSSPTEAATPYREPASVS